MNRIICIAFLILNQSESNFWMKRGNIHIHFTIYSYNIGKDAGYDPLIVSQNTIQEKSG